jgi:hypothetical protein
VIGGTRLVHVLQPRPELLVGLGVFELQGVDFLDRHHRHAVMDGAEDLALRLRIDAVCQSRQAFVQLLPECDPV